MYNNVKTLFLWEINFICFRGIVSEVIGKLDTI